MNGNVPILTALIAGLVSFLSPCVLPLVPPYLIFLAGTSLERLADAEPEPRVKRETVLAAALFVLGFSTVFVALGASASVIGSLIRAYSGPLSTIVGVVIIIRLVVVKAVAARAAPIVRHNIRSARLPRFVELVDLALDCIQLIRQLSDHLFMCGAHVLLLWRSVSDRLGRSNFGIWERRDQRGQDPRACIATLYDDLAHAASSLSAGERASAALLSTSVWMLPTPTCSSDMNFPKPA